MLQDLLKTKSGIELWLQVREQRNANLVNSKRILTKCKNYKLLVDTPAKEGRNGFKLESVLPNNITLHRSLNLNSSYEPFGHCATNRLDAWLLVFILVFYYMACVCSRYNRRSDWTILGHYPRNTHGSIMGLQNQNKKQQYQQLMNLERSFLTGKSQTSALPY